MSPSHRERFERGSLRLAEAVPLNLFHDAERAIAWHPGGGLELRQDADAMHLTATLPPIPAADRALALVRAGEATGLSLEFHSEAERRDGAIRVIEAARLSGVGLVRAPSYEASRVEARQRREFVRGGIRWNVSATCTCLDGSCNEVMFRPYAVGVVDGDDVLAHVGRATESIGSTRGGTLRLNATDDALEFSIDRAARDSLAGRQLSDLARAKVSVFGRPLLDDAASEFTEEGNVRIYKRAKVKSILLKPISGGPELRKGWDPLEIFDEADPPTRRRSRRWL